MASIDENVQATLDKYNTPGRYILDIRPEEYDSMIAADNIRVSATSVFTDNKETIIALVEEFRRTGSAPEISFRLDASDNTELYTTQFKTLNFVCAFRENNYCALFISAWNYTIALISQNYIHTFLFNMDGDFNLDEESYITAGVPTVIAAP